MPNDSVTLFGMSETVVRIGAFLSVFIIFSTLEAIFPRRPRVLNRWARWWTNGSMLVLANALVRVIALIFPLIAGTAAASLAASLNFGLYNNVDWPVWLEVTLSVILLDLAIWAQHVISHRVPFLWRLHRVHHSDRDLDASSALRFHPVEIALSALYKLVIILALGPAVLAVVLFEIILNASAMFNHANMKLPLWMDKILRTVIVTPDMHRVHHSVHRFEHDSNYGFCLSVWDHMFATYIAQPSEGQDGMTVGLDPYQSKQPEQLGWSLSLPVKQL